MSVTWTIESMQRTIKLDDKDDVVTNIHWRASDTDSDGNSATSFGSVGVTLGSGAFVAYADITEANAIQWAKDALGTDKVKEIEENIANKILLKKNPTTASGVSW
jgi:hypothetical protein